MAKLYEEVVIIKVSKLLKDSETAVQMLTDDTLLSLEEVVHELAGAGALVEIEKP